MREIIDQYFKDNYKFLLTVAHNINGNGPIPYEYHKDLINELYFFCLKKEDTLKYYYEQKGENGVKGFCIQWIKNQSYWKSDFKKKYNINIITQIEYESEKDTRTIINSDESDEYYNDLLNIHTEQQIEKIKKTKIIYNTLEQYEKNLFDMYVNEKMTMEQISIKVGISKASVHSMIRRLKYKINSIINSKPKKK